MKLVSQYSDWNDDTCTWDSESETVGDYYQSKNFFIWDSSTGRGTQGFGRDKAKVTNTDSVDGSISTYSHDTFVDYVNSTYKYKKAKSNELESLERNGDYSHTSENYWNQINYRADGGTSSHNFGSINTSNYEAIKLYLSDVSLREMDYSSRSGSCKLERLRAIALEKGINLAPVRLPND